MRSVTSICFLVFMICCGSAQSGFGGGYQSVSENIAYYGLLSASYLQAADLIDGGIGKRKIFKHVDKKEHYCSILAELLNIPEVVPDEYKLADPGLQSDDPLQLRLYAQSLRNYVNLGQSLMKEGEFSLRYMWNLNCSSHFDLRKSFADDPARDYVVSTSPDRKTLKIIGDIKKGLYGVVARRLRIHSSIENVELGSFGGMVYEAIKIGELIRKKRLNTVLSNNCFSACTLIFLAGVERRIPAPYYSLGFHRVTSRGWPLSKSDEVYEKIRRYVDNMIENGDEIVRADLAGDKNSYFMYDRKQLCIQRIATTIEGVCVLGTR